MSTKNITIQSQLQNNEVEVVIASSFDIFRKKLIIALVVILLFFAYSDKIWAQIESLYNSSTDQFAGISTLMSATANNDIEGVKFFSEAGPSVINQRNKGGATSLHIACREGNFDIVQILIENGANVNVVDNEGWSPLMRASLIGNDKIVEILLKNGAKAHLLNSLNETALIHATMAKCTQCINQIIENGNMIKNMDILVLKSQIADAFLVARSQENKHSQGSLEAFLDYVSKMAPLMSKNSTNEQELLPIINQTKINDPRFSKSSKNYILKNQDNETLRLDQENSYTVLEDPNLPSIPKRNKEIEISNNKLPKDLPKSYTKYAPVADGNLQLPKKYKFKSQTSPNQIIKQQEPLSYPIDNNQKTYTNIPNQTEQQTPRAEIKKFKFKSGDQTPKPQNLKTIQESELKKPQLTEGNLKKNNTIIAGNKKQPINAQNNPEIQENEDEETIFLIEKNPLVNKKLKSDDNVVNQESTPDLKIPENQNSANQNNKKIFKFKKVLSPNIDSQIKSKPTNEIKESSQNYQESKDLNEAKSTTIKKFKLKKIDNKIEEQNKDFKTNQEENI